MATLPAILDGKTWDSVELASKAVNVEYLDARLVRLVVRAGQVHQLLFLKPLVITSGNDGEHAIGSAHYRNLAVDLRSFDLTPVGQLVFLIILVNLGFEDGVGVFDERLKPDGQHYHCEVIA